MEIPTGSLAQFKHADVTVYVRATATPTDKAVFDAVLANAARRLVAGESPRISRDLAQLFCCGWAGVTLGGSPLPYSWAMLECAFPEKVLADLSAFVSKNVDILKSL